MNFNRITILCLGLIFVLSSCVSKKEYLLMQSSRDDYMRRAEVAKQDIAECYAQRDNLQDIIDQLRSQSGTKDGQLQAAEQKMVELNEQIEYLKLNNKDLLDQMANLSIISQTGAENIQKSLETLNEQGKYIKNLNEKIQNRDSVNLILAKSIKRSLGNVNDQDINVDVKGSVVLVSISDKMLFTSGQYVLSPRANEILGKIAKIANDHRDLDLLVEGHTDNVPISTSTLKDNWDLSAMRATAVVRSLQQNHGVSPSRMTAGARSEYVPKATNDTPEGRSTNRRTEIILLPKMDQYFNLIEEGVKQMVDEQNPQ